MIIMLYFYLYGAIGFLIFVVNTVISRVLGCVDDNTNKTFNERLYEVFGAQWLILPQGDLHFR